MQNSRAKEEKRDENNKNKNNTKIMKQYCATTLKRVHASSWSDLPLDLLGEIKKRLYWLDHVCFSSVCKSWQAAQHDKRPADVLPWLMVLDRENPGKISYKLYEPSTHHLAPIYSDAIDFHQLFDRRQYNTYKFTYRYGCLLISTCNKEINCTRLLLFSLATKRVILRLPQFYHPSVIYSKRCTSFTAISNNPTSPDCVFLVVHTSGPGNNRWTIGIFRHGDKKWTTTKHAGVRFSIPYHVEDVFIGEVFYFMTPNGDLASYDIVSRKLIIGGSLSTELRSWSDRYKLFGLDGELMLTYYDLVAGKFFIKSYDFSQKVWVPLKSLGDRSLYISKYSVYTDTLNYYKVSANKIYMQENGNCHVYSFENGELSKCTSSGLGYWDSLDLRCTSKTFIWVEPPHLLPKQGISLRPTHKRQRVERIQWS